MQRRTAWAIVISLLVVLAAVAGFAFYGIGSQNAGATRRAADYLVANYNPSIGMISETPKGDTYFVYSDNFLAAYVLGRSGNTSFPAIAANITATDDRYLKTVQDPTNQYQIIGSSNGSFFASSNYVFARVGSSVIETTLNNGSAPLSPQHYADIAFLEALFWHQIPSGYAINDFSAGASQYDGQGFKDQAFTGVYQTYKLALYDYVGKVLGLATPRGLEANLSRLQAPDGGFYTGYGPGLVPNGNSTNTETTSLAILALSTPGAKAAAQPYPTYLPVFIAAIAAIVLVEVLLIRRRSRRHEEPPENTSFS